MKKYLLKDGVEILKNVPNPVKIAIARKWEVSDKTDDD